MSIVFVFPGQGSQFIGMGKFLSENFKEANSVFQEIDDSLGKKLSQLIFTGEIEELTLTYNTQPALMAVSMAVIKILENSGFLMNKLSYVAGHSLGEYSALCAAGAYSIADTAKLLCRRGEAMQSSSNVLGSMIALLGASLEEATMIATEAREGEVCDIANDNAPGQLVLSGSKSAIERAVTIASKYGKRAIKLNVSAAFHSSLMENAAIMMEEEFKKYKIQEIKTKIIANVTADIVNDISIMPSLLIQQIAGRVRWRETILKMKELGVTKICEVGAGKVLTNMIKRIDKDIQVENIYEPQEIENFLKNYNN